MIAFITGTFQGAQDQIRVETSWTRISDNKYVNKKGEVIRIFNKLESLRGLKIEKAYLSFDYYKLSIMERIDIETRLDCLNIVPSYRLIGEK